nr:MAG TPA: hypothetical protein [Caudoviricetes sp.]
MKKQELKKFAQEALQEYCGFAPKLKQIVLLESYTEHNVCIYLMFKIDGYENLYQVTQKMEKGWFLVQGRCYIMNIVEPSKQ